MRIARATTRRRAGVRVAFGSTWITAAGRIAGVPAAVGIAGVGPAELAAGVFTAHTGVDAVATGVRGRAAGPGVQAARIATTLRRRVGAAGVALSGVIVAVRSAGVVTARSAKTAGPAGVAPAGWVARGIATRVGVVAARVLAVATRVTATRVTTTRALAAIRVIAAENVRTTRVVAADVNCPARTAVFHDGQECVEVRFLSCQSSAEGSVGFGARDAAENREIPIAEQHVVSRVHPRAP